MTVVVVDHVSRYVVLVLEIATQITPKTYLDLDVVDKLPIWGITSTMID